MSFLEHLDELRKRIIRSCIAIVVGVVATFAFIQPIFDFILRPTRQVLPAGVRLIYTQPGEAFSLYVTVALIAGVLVASPFIMYQVWMFIAPGLYSNEKKMAYPFVALTTLGFVLGAAFNHYVAFSLIMRFFGSFNTADLAFMPRIQDVFGLYTKMLLGLGLVFQMPTIVLLPREDEARHGAVPGHEHQVRDPDHLHHRGGRHAWSRYDGPGGRCGADAWPLPGQHRDRLGRQPAQPADSKCGGYRLEVEVRG